MATYDDFMPRISSHYAMPSVIDYADNEPMRSPGFLRRYSHASRHDGDTLNAAMMIIIKFSGCPALPIFIFIFPRRAFAASRRIARAVSILRLRLLLVTRGAHFILSHARARRPPLHAAAWRLPTFRVSQNADDAAHLPASPSAAKSAPPDDHASRDRHAAAEHTDTSLPPAPHSRQQTGIVASRGLLIFLHAISRCIFL